MFTVPDLIALTVKSFIADIDEPRLSLVCHVALRLFAITLVDLDIDAAWLSAILLLNIFVIGIVVVDMVGISSNAVRPTASSWICAGTTLISVKVVVAVSNWFSFKKSAECSLLRLLNRGHSVVILE